MSKDRFAGKHIELFQLPSLITVDVIDNMLSVASECGASDVMFRSGTEVRARVNGAITKITDVSIDKEDIARFIGEAETNQLVTSVTAGHPRSFPYRVISKGKIQRFRMSVAAVNEERTEQGMRLVCRPISSRPPRLQELCLPKDLYEALTTKNNKGIILITGETGSGKSTLLSSTLDQKARDEGIHIGTIEDPIEYNLFYLNNETDSLVGQAGLNSHLHTYSEGLKGLLRDNPDVIMVGEMRDTDTIKLGVEASRTGHLVYSTLHVTNVAATVDRICVNFAEGERLAIALSLIDSLRTVVNQQLVPKLCQSCATPVRSDDEMLKETGADLSGARQPCGCDVCANTGYSGRVPLIEYLVFTNHTRSLLLRTLISEGIQGITMQLHELTENHGATKLMAATNAFEAGLISPEVFYAIYLENRTIELVNGNG